MNVALIQMRTELVKETNLSTAVSEIHAAAQQGGRSGDFTGDVLLSL